MSKSKKAAKTAAKKRSAVMTDEQYTGENQQAPPINTQADPTAPTALTTTAPAPQAIEGEVVPHPSQVDPHTLVDMRIRHDPRFLGEDAQLLPTTDPNFMYVKPKA